MFKLCTVSFYPNYGCHDFICDAMMQIVFSHTGIIPVWNHEVDPFSIEFYASTLDEMIIQQKIDIHLPKIINIVGHQRNAIWQYLFDHALYVAPRKRMVQHRLRAI